MTSQPLGPIIASCAGIATEAHTVAQPSQADLSPLPAGFPASFDSRLAFEGARLANESEYVLTLSSGEVAEIKAALQYFRGLEVDGDLVSRQTFPLPVLGKKLDEVSEDVYNGRGFCLIRGIQPGEFSVEDMSLVYLGVQSYIADKRACQDSRGNMLVHIIADSTTRARQNHHRHSTDRITFHNEESGDVIGWLTRSTAVRGGKCIIASAYTIYNFLASHRPDIIRTLARADWPFALPRFQCRPIIFHHEAKLIMNFGRASLLGSANHPRKAGLPTLTPRQMEALDAIEAIACATQLEISTQAGDMHFINNLAVLHRREGFVDGAGPSEKRHLVRMRLRSSERGWDIPEPLQREWSDAFERNAVDRVWHLEPMPDAFFPLRKYPN